MQYLTSVSKTKDMLQYKESVYFDAYEIGDIQFIFILRKMYYFDKS